MIDTRNYMTHYNQDLKNKSAQSNSLYKLTIMLEILFQLHILKDLGFTILEIKQICQSSFKLRQKLSQI